MYYIRSPEVELTSVVKVFDSREVATLQCTAAGGYPPIHNMSLVKNSQVILNRVSSDITYTTSGGLPRNVYGLYECIVNNTAGILSQAILLQHKGIHNNLFVDLLSLNVREIINTMYIYLCTIITITLFYFNFQSSIYTGHTSWWLSSAGCEWQLMVHMHLVHVCMYLTVNNLFSFTLSFRYSRLYLHTIEISHTPYFRIFI